MLKVTPKDQVIRNFLADYNSFKAIREQRIALDESIAQHKAQIDEMLENAIKHTSPVVPNDVLFLETELYSGQIYDYNKDEIVTIPTAQVGKYNGQIFIIAPSSFFTVLTEEEQEITLTHEMGHVVNGDTIQTHPYITFILDALYKHQNLSDDCAETYSGKIEIRADAYAWEQGKDIRKVLNKIKELYGYEYPLMNARLDAVNKLAGE